MGSLIVATQRARSLSLGASRWRANAIREADHNRDHLEITTMADSQATAPNRSRATDRIIDAIDKIGRAHV